MATTIKAKKDLYNSGKCFTKGRKYQVEKNITMAASLLEAKVINDQGQEHNIGSWWREFEIVN